jgi:pyruvate/2-oxoglutarate dehydrogenase complex dihydrolipoamide dehydrogenase (E3) component
MAEQVDAIIIGSGQAGNPLAGAFAGKGKRVVVIESKHVGGTCVNEGCTPTKTMVASAKIADQARRGPEFGVHTGSVRVNLEEVRKRKREVVDVWRSGSEKKLEDEKNIELVRGLGSFSGSKTVSVELNGGGTRSFTAEHIFINTGLRSATPDIQGLDDVPFLTNESVMELDHVPERLLILGGSYIAVEFAQMFRRFGSAVTIISNGPQLMPREEADIAECLGEIFAEDGIDVILNAKATKVAKGIDGITLTMHTKAGISCWQQAAPRTAMR